MSKELREVVKDFIETFFESFYKEPEFVLQVKNSFNQRKDSQLFSSNEILFGQCVIIPRICANFDNLNKVSKYRGDCITDSKDIMSPHLVQKERKGNEG